MLRYTMHLYSLLVIFCFSCFLSACSTARPVQPDSIATPGAAVESIASTVALSLRTAEKNISGRGVMVYQRPGRLRLVMFSPFGTTVMDTILDGESLTIAYPASGVAYQGRITELPVSAGQRGFAMLGWVLESEPPHGAPATGETERQATKGGVERISLKDGLVLEKSLKTGERVVYRNHKVLAGVRVPLELQMESADGDRIRIVLEDPEVNGQIEEHAFSLRLQGLQIFPLGQLKVN